MYDTLVTLKKGAGRTLKAGGMWVYDNEIESIAGDFENGDIVTIHDFDGFFLGIGFINTRSKLTVRRFWKKECRMPGITGNRRWIPAAAD